MPRSQELSPPALNTDVRKRGYDPFFIGLLIGAIAAVIGFLIGLFYFR